MAIVLTETAAGEIKRYLESQKLDPSTPLRIGIAGGGCAGFQYTLGFDTEVNPAVDTRSQQHGVTLVTKKIMALHLDGTTVDFQDGPMGRGFAIDNPSVPRGGGCPGCGGH